MTRKQFDAVTKENWGSDCMARDERSDYRRSRRVVIGDDMIARRAAEMVRRNHAEWVALDGRLDTLGLASKWRSVASERARSGLSLLRL